MMVVVNESGRVRSKQAHAGRAMAVVNLIVRSSSKPHSPKQTDARRSRHGSSKLHTRDRRRRGWALSLGKAAHLGSPVARSTRDACVCVCVCLCVCVCVCACVRACELCCSLILDRLAGHICFCKQFPIPVPVFVLPGQVDRIRAPSHHARQRFT